MLWYNVIQFPALCFSRVSRGTFLEVHGMNLSYKFGHRKAQCDDIDLRITRIFTEDANNAEAYTFCHE